MSTNYNACKAHCLALYHEPLELRRSYPITEELPQIVLACWMFPANRDGGGLTRLVHTDGPRSPVIEELTLEGEQAAYFKLRS